MKLIAQLGSGDLVIKSQIEARRRTIITKGAPFSFRLSAFTFFLLHHPPFPGIFARIALYTHVYQVNNMYGR